MEERPKYRTSATDGYLHCDERYFGRKRFYPSEFWLSHFLRTDHAPTHLVALPAHSTSAHAPSSPLVLLLFWSPPGEKHAPSPSPRLNSWRAGKRERESGRRPPRERREGETDRQPLAQATASEERQGTNEPRRREREREDGLRRRRGKEDGAAANDDKERARALAGTDTLSGGGDGTTSGR